MEMDMKVIEQLVAQALKEMKAEEPAAFVKPKERTVYLLQWMKRSRLLQKLRKRFYSPKSKTARDMWT